VEISVEKRVFCRIFESAFITNPGTMIMIPFLRETRNGFFLMRSGGLRGGFSLPELFQQPFEELRGWS
jgi:hypothetical protein